MELPMESPQNDIREIEDIIDMQKANGNLNVRQVVFDVPQAQAQAQVQAQAQGGSELQARSLESGVRAWGGGGGGGGSGGGGGGGTRRKRRRAERRAGSPTGGADGVSWPSDSDITVLRVAAAGGGRSAGDGSSMVNLATLVQPSQPASKHSLLLPLSSWAVAPPAPPVPPPPPPPPEPRKARLARFLRLYFCPCCTCLYEMERRCPRQPRDAPSVYFTAC